MNLGVSVTNWLSRQYTTHTWTDKGEVKVRTGYKLDPGFERGGIKVGHLVRAAVFAFKHV